MKSVIIFSSSLIILSGCSSKLDSLNLKENQDDIFYGKDFSVMNSLFTTIVVLPLSLVVDTLGLITLQKPTITINIMKNGYIYKSKDTKNINILATNIEKTLLKKNHFKRLKNNDIYSYFNLFVR